MIYKNLELKNKFTDFLEKEVSTCPTLNLDIIQIGDNLASEKYVEIKKKIGLKIGVKVNHYKFNSKSSFEEVKNQYKLSISNSKGLIFQLPIPTGYHKLVLDTPKNIDVDMLGNQSTELWDKGLLPPTIGAIDLVLKDILSPEKQTDKLLSFDLDLKGLNIGVIGQGVLVGNPLLRYLKDRYATIISLNEYSKEPEKLTSNCDIVISAAGSPRLVNNKWLKDGAIIIDASTSEDSGKLIGDIDYQNIQENITISKSPGGIGPITVLYLFYNLFKLSKI